jgi:hypothetical protein
VQDQADWSRFALNPGEWRPNKILGVNRPSQFAFQDIEAYNVRINELFVVIDTEGAFEAETIPGQS